MIKLAGLDFKVERELAVKLVAHVEKNLPAKLMQDKRHILSANKITRVLEQASEQVTDYKLAFKPGFIRRVVFANNLKWGLRNKGFPDDFVSVMTESLIVTLARKQPSK